MTITTKANKKIKHWISSIHGDYLNVFYNMLKQRPVILVKLFSKLSYSLKLFQMESGLFELFFITMMIIIIISFCTKRDWDVYVQAKKKNFSLNYPLNKYDRSECVVCVKTNTQIHTYQLCRGMCWQKPQNHPMETRMASKCRKEFKQTTSKQLFFFPFNRLTANNLIWFEVRAILRWSSMFFFLLCFFWPKSQLNVNWKTCKATDVHNIFICN